jgi:hypothetical protein
MAMGEVHFVARSLESRTSTSLLVSDVSNQWIMYDILSAPFGLSFDNSWHTWLAIAILLIPVYWIVYRLSIRRMRPVVGVTAVILYLMGLWFLWGIVCVGLGC